LIARIFGDVAAYNSQFTI